jgi:chemotaxis response regulator CheB
MVVLYGKSLFVAGVETFLKDRPDLDVVRINTTLPETAERVQSLCPDVIIFDSGETEWAILPGIYQLLKTNSGFLVIGLDLNTSNEVTVFSSQQYSVTKVEDLVEAIQIGTSRD